jgi:hypothetical protein
MDGIIKLLIMLILLFIVLSVIVPFILTLFGGLWLFS